MRKLICVFVLVLTALSAEAATLTADVEIPDPIVTEVLATVNAWRVAQLNSDGTPKYLTLKALGDSILREAIVRIIQAQCAADPTTCPTVIQAKIDARQTAKDEVVAEIDSAIAVP